MRPMSKRRSIIALSPGRSQASRIAHACYLIALPHAAALPRTPPLPLVGGGRAGGAPLPVPNPPAPPPHPSPTRGEGVAAAWPNSIRRASHRPQQDVALLAE